jgi:monoamine oxidase
MSTSSSVDVVIVGAGAAGLAAARTAGELGLDYVLVEASDRIGGRALTDVKTLGYPFDMGCHWLHSADINPMRELADLFGFRYRSEPIDWRLHLEGHWLTEAEKGEVEAELERHSARIHEFGDAGKDVPFTEAVDLNSRWNIVLRSIVAAEWGFGLADVSTLDYCRYRDTDKNWPVEDGYGALVARHAKGIPVSLSTTVEHIDWSGERVKAETTQGTIDAAAVIVTASTSALAAGVISFFPALPVEKQEAFDAVPLGNANKVAFLLNGGLEEMPDHSGILTEIPSGDAISFQIKPFGRPIAGGYLAGESGRALEREGEAAMVDAALSALVSVFGSDIKMHVVKTLCSKWDHEPYIRGGYAAANPGYAHKRADLGTPVGDKVFFAGEATSPDFFSTCHGAHMTGISVVQEVAKVVGSRPPAAARR